MRCSRLARLSRVDVHLVGLATIRSSTRTTFGRAAELFRSACYALTGIHAMKTFLSLVVLFLSASLQAADLPTGQKTPEGVACDAVMAYINRDSKAWLATLVRPIYGEEGNK